jgi:hypothetical protein
MALNCGPSDDAVDCWFLVCPHFIQAVSRQREISGSPGLVNKKECKVIEITINCRNSNIFDEMVDRWMTWIDN